MALCKAFAGALYAYKQPQTDHTEPQLIIHISDRSLSAVTLPVYRQLLLHIYSHG